MKKIITLILALVMTMSLCACGGGGGETAEEGGAVKIMRDPKRK